ncbi:MAG: 30S ribosomal protein S30e [Candidatus Lokiarchaeota archaeon]|nr:30S ribosomal protein S30e [Candidatus Lokiarchaeota archaeon]
MPGSHGSLTKAGKVKQQTPKIRRTGVNSKKKKPPRMRFRELYVQRVEKGRYGGQKDSLGAKRASYKR